MAWERDDGELAMELVKQIAESGCIERLVKMCRDATVDWHWKALEEILYDNPYWRRV